MGKGSIPPLTKEIPLPLFFLQAEPVDFLSPSRDKGNHSFQRKLNALFFFFIGRVLSSSLLEREPKKEVSPNKKRPGTPPPRFP